MRRSVLRLPARKGLPRRTVGSGTELCRGVAQPGQPLQHAVLGISLTEVEVPGDDQGLADDGHAHGHLNDLADAVGEVLVGDVAPVAGVQMGVDEGHGARGCGKTHAREALAPVVVRVIDTLGTAGQEEALEADRLDRKPRQDHQAAAAEGGDVVPGVCEARLASSAQQNPTRLGGPYFLEGDGVEVEGFESTDPNVVQNVLGNVLARLWVNVETKLPVRYDIEVLSDDGEPLMNMSVCNFQWDVEVEPGFFVVSIPEDDELMAEVELAGGEKSLAEGLGVFAEMTGTRLRERWTT